MHHNLHMIMKSVSMPNADRETEVTQNTDHSRYWASYNVFDERLSWIVFALSFGATKETLRSEYALLPIFLKIDLLSERPLAPHQLMLA